MKRIFAILMVLMIFFSYGEARLYRFVDNNEPDKILGGKGGGFHYI